MTHRFGVIGVGTWGEQHLKAISTHPHCELAIICDLDEGLVKRRAAEYGAKAWTTDYRGVLDQPDIAAVSIVTPDHAHRQIAVAAAEAGKHILIEKPLATTVDECEAILAAAEANGVRIMVDFHNRFNVPFVNAKRAIEDGEIGEPQMLSMRLNDTIFVPTGMLSWAGKSTVAWFLASHGVDLVRWLMDDEIVRVHSVARSRVLAKMGINTPDFFQTILELAKGGVAHIENCWIMSTSMPTVFDFKVELIGDKGTLFADLSSHRMLQKYTPAEAVYPDCTAVPMVHGRYVGFAIESIRHWLDSVIQDKDPMITGEDGLAATRVVCAIHESAESGQPVELA